MGRYYYGDIEGKFWFGVQPSDDAEQFGALESSSIFYEVADNDECTERLKEIFAELGMPEDFGMTHDDVWSAYQADSEGSDEKRQALYASLELGLKIYQCVEKNGFCSFEAEG